MVLAWQGLLLVLGVSPFLAKGPADVFTWLFTLPAAAENRAAIGENLVVTLGDANLGFVAGLVTALVLAVVFTLFRGVENALMPLAPLLRSGALLAEWLSTGRGRGNGIVTAVAQVRNSEVWASVVVITVVSLVLYGTAQLMETLVLRRRGMTGNAR